jgi:hypothetical protein
MRRQNTLAIHIKDQKLKSGIACGDAEFHFFSPATAGSTYLIFNI